MLQRWSSHCWSNSPSQSQHSGEAEQSASVSFSNLNLEPPTGRPRQTIDSTRLGGGCRPGCVRAAPGCGSFLPPKRVAPHWVLAPIYDTASLAMRWSAFLAVALLSAPFVAGAAEFHGRGVYYFDGPVRSPLAGIGRRGDFAT